MAIDQYGMVINEVHKPYRGRMDHWIKYGPQEHYVIRGRFIDHVKFAGEFGQTSYVVAHDKATGEIETMNSKYTLIGKEEPPLPSPGTMS